MKKSDQFKGKVAVVTGAGSGIGRAVAQRLGQLGAVVVAADINLMGAEETAKSIMDSGGTAQAIKVDVTKQVEVQKLVDDTVQRHGRLDYMFNNAGIAIIGETRDMADEHWKKIIDINLVGVLSGTLAAYHIMTKQGSGHIVNTASLAGLIPVPTETAYCLTKYAVVGLSTSLRGEGAGLGVKVSVICPGFVRTPIIDNYIPVGFERDSMAAKMPPIMTDVDKAARIILAGVAKNRAIILVGNDAHIAWRLYKLWGGLVEYLGRRGLADFRKLRKEG